MTTASRSDSRRGDPARPDNRLLRLRVNGTVHSVAAPPHAILLDVLRDVLGLVGTKRGCDMGTCGCCNVLIDGRAVMSCLVLAHDAQGKDIQTIEGLAFDGPDMHPLSKAWAECGGSQCGFCTPGFIVTCHELLANEAAPSRTRIAEAISGNVCRCTGYKKILDAVELAAARIREAEPASAPAKSGGSK
ncbi:MAG: (2Fe-2S)-binding protein [Planctomycetes bacterium]|nr:(2Fe-2S)-binding protein [Planctomycetota bacterium]MCB9918137.1 (2Fe-2S)-binding protein [Planctomycetota bacterium]